MSASKEAEETTVARRNNRKYCEYHQDYGHTTTEYWTLARVIQDLEIALSWHKMEEEVAAMCKPTTWKSRT